MTLLTVMPNGATSFASVRAKPVTAARMLLDRIRPSTGCFTAIDVMLKRNTTIEDVGGAALFLLSDLGAGTTGEVLHVDSGYHVVGMKAVDAPDISVV